MNSSDFIVFGQPQICESEIEEVVATMRSGWLGTGPKVAKFEKDFALYKGLTPELVAAVNSCTAAIHVSLVALKLPIGSEVITTPLTFCATINAIIHAGLTPVLADIDTNTQNIDPVAIEAAITPNTRAILPVHFAGRPCDMDAIMDIAKRHKLIVIEDCAHAIETEYKGRKAGTFGDFGCFSFYSTKNLATGEGGMITSNHESLVTKARMLALHGMDKDAWHRFSDKGYKHYQVRECGFKYNMMDLQAAIGIHQLNRIENNWLKRQQVWNSYQIAFKDLDIICPEEPEHGTKHGYHLYTILIDENKCNLTRDEFLNKMNQAKIGTGVHYLSIPEHPYYQERFGWQPEKWPKAMKIGQQTVSLPISPKLTELEVQRIINTVISILTGQSL